MKFETIVVKPIWKKNVLHKCEIFLVCYFHDNLHLVHCAQKCYFLFFTHSQSVVSIIKYFLFVVYCWFQKSCFSLFPSVSNEYLSQFISWNRKHVLWFVFMCISIYLNIFLFSRENVIIYFCFNSDSIIVAIDVFFYFPCYSSEIFRF